MDPIFTRADPLADATAPNHKEKQPPQYTPIVNNILSAYAVVCVSERAYEMSISYFLLISINSQEYMFG